MLGMRRLLRVLSSKHGAIGLMFGLIWGPLIGWSFMAITLSLKTASQYVADSALDAALIAAAATPVTALPTGDTISVDRGKILNVYWKADGGPKACANNDVLSDPVESSNNTISARIQCHSTTATSTNYFVAQSVVQLQGAVIEIAMVLDNTGSMQQYKSSTNTNSSSSRPSKMSGLKVGAFDFLNQLAPYATAAGQIKVSIVPMTTDINIGNTATTQAMVKYSYQTNDNATHDSQILSSRYGGSPCAPINGTSGNNAIYDSAPANILAGNTYDSAQGLSTTTGCGSSSLSGAYTIPAAGVTSSTWTGCVVDRDAVISGVAFPSTNTSGTDYEASNALPTVNPPYSLFPADNINCGGTTVGPVPLVPLTDLYICTSTPSLCTTASTATNTAGTSATINALPKTLMSLLYCRNFGSDKYCSNYVNTVAAGTSGNPAVTALTSYTSNSGAMVANGDTDLPIGLAWGWNMLTPGFPLSTNAATTTVSAVVDKFIVFFTDGYNTQDRYNFSQQDGDTAQLNMNSETTAMCNAIKANSLDPYNSANKITIYTLKTSDAAALVDTCATNSSDAFTITTPDAIDGALQSILSKITALRINS